MNQIMRKLAPRIICGGGIILGLLFIMPPITCAQAISMDENTRQRARIYESLFITAANQHNIDARLLWVIAYLESRFRPLAVSPKGARGLMQLMPATAARWGVQNPHEPVQAITGAAHYVQYLGQRFAGRVDLTLAAYNAGEAAVDAYQAGRAVQVGRKLINPFGIRTDGVPPYRETRAYVGAGVALLRRFSVGNTAMNVAYTSEFSAEHDPKSVVTFSSTATRKSISYAPDVVPSVQSVPTTTMPRSISYQSR